MLVPSSGDKATDIESKIVFRGQLVGELPDEDAVAAMGAKLINKATSQR
jgi:hypothetical protein